MKNGRSLDSEAIGVITRARRCGMIYLSRADDAIRSGYWWPWPGCGADLAEERAAVMEQVSATVAQVGPGWCLYFVEEGLPLRRAMRWPLDSAVRSAG